MDLRWGTTKWLLVFSSLAIPLGPDANAVEEDEPWPEQGLEMRVDAPGPWLAGSTRVASVSVHEAPTPLALRPAAGAEVAAFVEREGHRPVRASARSDARGRASIRIALPRVPGQVTVVFRARRQGAGAIVGRGVELEDARVAHVQTDRRLYQPGDHLGFRALVVRRPDLHPTSGAPVSIRVLAPDGATLVDEEKRTSRFGVVHLDLDLPPRARTGTWRAVVRAGGTELGETTFLVAHRVLPRLRVEVSGERGWVRPGSAVGVRVRSTYLHGAPVSGGRVVLRDQNGAEKGTATLAADGSAEIEVAAPTAPGPLLLRAEVRSPDESVASASTTVVVSRNPFLVGLDPEGDTLVEGVLNRIGVSVRRPDDTPATGRVELRVAPDSFLVDLDEEGRGTFVVAGGREAIEHQNGPCAGMRGRVASVRVETGGEPAWDTELCLPVDPSIRLLVRAPEQIAERGVPLAVEVQAPREARNVVTEAFWRGAPVARAVLAASRGQWRGTLDLPDGIVGPVAVRASANADGERLVSAARTTRVEPPVLRVEVEGAGDTHRPRARANLRVKVRDASGRPVQAALAVAVVDEASERAAALPEREPALDEMTGSVPDAPPEEDPWSDPDEKLRALVEEAVPEIFRAVEARLASAGPDEVGVWEAGRWRFKHELLRALIEASNISEGSLEGLGGRTIGLADLEAFDRHFRFDTVATRITRSRLVQLLVALRNQAVERGGDLVLRPRLDVAALLEDARQGTGVEADGWGRPFFVRRAERPRFVLSHALAGWEIGSPGPDGIAGNSDDLVDPLEAAVPPDSPYGRAVNEPGGREELASEILAADMLGNLQGLLAVEGQGVGGLGAVGFGRGAGGFAAPRVMMGAAGRIGARAVGPTVRDRFPETLLWLPDLVTDERGEADVPLDLADSLTTWRIRLLASSLDGAIGEATNEVVVSQPLFVDVSAPPAWTEGDRIEVPIAVHNHTGATVDISLSANASGALVLDGDGSARLRVEDGGVSTHRFSVRASARGRGLLGASAEGGGHADAVERSIRVLPAAREVVVGKSGVLEGDTSVEVEVPPDALPGTAALRVRLHAGFASVAIDGLEELLREPYGCFEQTSSVTYPNLLILGYLARAGGGSPAVMTKARDLVARGYERLRTFEVSGGGFSWFGDAPANLILTAYGLREFADMAAVHSVDPALLRRTREFLLRRQREDGSWSEPNIGFADGVTNDVAGKDLRTTAYVTWSLAHAGVPAENLSSAAAYLRTRAPRSRDPYAIALSAVALSSIDEGDAVARSMWRELVGGPPAGTDPLKVSSEGARGILHSGGPSVEVELTALAGFAAARSGDPAAARVAAALVEARNGRGGWGTTQATVLSLQALLAVTGRRSVSEAMNVAVDLDGRRVGTARLDPARVDEAAVVAVPRLGPGTHTVRLRPSRAETVLFDAAVESLRPWSPRPEDRGIAVQVLGRAAALSLDRPLPVRVRVQNTSGRAIEMPMVRVGVPAGFEVDASPLVSLVENGSVATHEDTGRSLDVYLPRLGGGATLTLPIRLVPRHLGRVALPATTAYAYYEPGVGGSSPPRSWVVAR